MISNHLYCSTELNISHHWVLSHSILSDSLQPHGLWPARLLCPWGVSRQEYWSGLSCPPPGDLPNPGIKPTSHVSHIAGGFFTIWATRKPISSLLMFIHHTEFIRRNKASIESTTGPVVGIITSPPHTHPKRSTLKSPKPLKMLP